MDKDAEQNTLQNFVVVFTGFKHDNIKYTKTLKNKLVSKLKKLNITVPPESKEREVLDSNITHIVSTPTARTMVSLVDYTINIVESVTGRYDIFNFFSLTVKFLTENGLCPQNGNFYSFNNNLGLIILFRIQQVGILRVTDSEKKITQLITKQFFWVRVLCQNSKAKQQWCTSFHISNCCRHCELLIVSSRNCT